MAQAGPWQSTMASKIPEPIVEPMAIIVRSNSVSFS
jgi:hypothetical protein